MSLATALTPVTITLPRDQGSVSGVGSELWWVSSRLEGEGHRYWLHYCVVNVYEPEPSILGWMSITDETAGEHRHETFTYSPDQATIATDDLDVQIPDIRLSGPLEEMTLAAQVPGGATEVVLRPDKPVLYACGVGSYPLLDATTYQYSIAGVPTTGTVTIGDRTVAVTGTSWYDRQWFLGELPADLVWLGICLDNGDAVSLFDTTPSGPAWATVGHTDGSCTVSAVAPLPESATGEVTVEGSGHVFAGGWRVQIPALDADLTVSQSYLHENFILYTGKLEVTGTYRGQPVTGFGFVDIPVHGMA
jgi:predicted secreted hydrolase